MPDICHLLEMMSVVMTRMLRERNTDGKATLKNPRVDVRSQVQGTRTRVILVFTGKQSTKKKNVSNS